MEGQLPFLFEETTDLEIIETQRTSKRLPRQEVERKDLNLFLFPELKEEPVLEVLSPSSISKLTTSLRSEDVMAAMTDPVIIYGLWGDAVPQWLKKQIRIDRLRLLEAKIREIGTDSEALAYICTGSLSFPLNHDWATIYQYLLTKIFSFLGKEVPDDLKVEKISSFQESLLSDLKHWIYRVRRRSSTKLRKKGEKYEKETNEKGPL